MPFWKMFTRKSHPLNSNTITAAPRNFVERSRFSLLAYKQMCPNGSLFMNNLLVSPLSMEMALLMAYLGAEGNTRQEIADLLGLNAQYTIEDLSGNIKQIKAEGIHQPEPLKVITATGYYMHDSDDESDPIECYTLYMANAAFVHEDFPLKSSYISTLESLFNASCLPVDFAAEDHSAVRIVNEFVGNRTNGLLRDLLAPDDVDALARIVLVNALYFKSNWECQFNEERTAKKPFTTGSGSEIMVDTMHMTARLNYCKCKDLGDAKILQMPYVENVCSAFFLLPGKGKLPKDSIEQGMTKLSNLLTATSLFNAIQSMYEVEHVTVQIPKFRVKENLDLDRLLIEMGMPTAFDLVQADFSGICEERSMLYISKVKQQAYIDVNERGTEAAASTADVMRLCGLGDDTKAEFVADRPFMFFIRHDKTNTILFMGHIADPTIS